MNRDVTGQALEAFIAEAKKQGLILKSMLKVLKHG